LEIFSERNRNSFLLACLLFTIGVTPIIMDFFAIRVITAIALSLVTISAIYAITHKKNVFVIGIILAVFSIASIWWSFISQQFMAQLAHYLINIIFIAFITFHIFVSTFKSKIVHRGVIHGAIVVYLLIGFFWSYVYTLIEYLHPGSFAKIGETLKFGYQPLMYFSFVTLTTLGFGDITPATAVARSLVILEAITGQFYLIINVSWLVGLYVAHTRDQRKL
jgi:voltage-gated potassium channel